MNLRYSANIMKFQDGMQKVSAVAWAPTGKKLAIASADKVLLFPLSQSICSTTPERRRTSSPPSPPTRGRNPT